MQTSFEDITIQFKKTCAEVTSDKLWLTPVKVWELVRDELIGNFAKGVVIPKSDQVSTFFI